MFMLHARVAEWQTRMIQVHVGDSMGSSPFSRTKREYYKYVDVAEWQTRTFEGRMVNPCEFKSHRPHQKALTVL